MKKSIIKLVSLMLVFAISVVWLSSCSFLENIFDSNSSSGVNGNHPKIEFYPDGYTAGFPGYVNRSDGSFLEFWWVETYEECVAAMELLKSHGSTFIKTAIFTYEGDLFDTKYYFKISRGNIYTEDIEFGDNPFDRRAMDIEVMSIAFFDDVTIDEINHGDVDDYQIYGVDSRLFYYEEEPTVFGDHIIYEWRKAAHPRGYDYYIYDVSDLKQKELLLQIGSFGYPDNPEYANQCIEAVLDSIEFLGFDD